jgi:hypothetical protein
MCTIRCPSHHLAAVLSNNKSTNLLLDLKLSKNAPVGDLKVPVYLKVPNIAEEIEVIVTARIVPPVMSSPASIHLFPSASGTLKPAYFMIWKTDQTPIKQIRQIDVPGSLRVEQMLDDSSVRRRFLVSLNSPERPTGSIQIKMFVDDLPDPLMIGVEFPSASLKE